MELGTLQKAWVKSLREHPERQSHAKLGQIHNRETNNYTACCLGELKLVYCQLNNLPLPFNEDGYITDSSGASSGSSQSYLVGSWEKFGLRSDGGKIMVSMEKDGRSFPSLAHANDGGITWAEIADYIEANPENVFTKSV